MSPKESKLAAAVNAVNFAYYLGASVASPLVNLTQIAQATLPVLGAQHGWGKASRMLAAAFRDSARTGGNMLRVLTSDEDRMAYRVLDSRGDFQRTRAHDLAGHAEGALLTTNPAASVALDAVSYLFHKSEVVNREASGMAAFRLARSSGMDFEKAIQYASDVTNGTHFDYSAENRPPIMQGNAMRIVTQFKNYSVGMSWMLYRNLYQAFADATPAAVKAKLARGEQLTRGEQATVDRARAVRSEARKVLTGMLGVTAMLAGTMGLPLINALRLVANAAHMAFGDDDDPWSFDVEFRAWLASVLGEDAAKWVADGPVNRLTGANLASRVSLSSLWMRDSDRELQGSDAYHDLLEGLVGPTGGMVKNMYVGLQRVNEGHVWRGVETMMPKFAKDAMKATRFAADGVNSLRGDPIVPDVSTSEALIQSLGFQPTRLFEQQKQNSALMGYSEHIQSRRQALMNAYALAVNADTGRDTVMAKIHAFNARYPEIAIKSESLRQSLRARGTAPKPRTESGSTSGSPRASGSP